MAAFHRANREELIRLILAERERADRNGRRADALEVRLGQVRAELAACRAETARTAPSE